MKSTRRNTERLLWPTAVLAAALFTSPALAQATLNKCIDARGKVTYSNLPCRNAREARTVEIVPPPTPDARRPEPVAPQPAKAAPPKPAGVPQPASIELETRQTSGKPSLHGSARQCDALTDKLGRMFDKMDQARRKGYTQEQMDAWNREVKALERKKQQSGCF